MNRSFLRTLASARIVLSMATTLSGPAPGRSGSRSAATRPVIVSALLLFPVALGMVGPAQAGPECLSFVCAGSGIVTAVSTSDAHTCVLLSTGNVDCYGPGVTSAWDYAGGDAVAVSVGEAHRCVLLDTGNVDCYGDNYYGQAADYTGGHAIAISAGGRHTCVLLDTGNVDCSGFNYGGSAQDYLEGNATAVSTGEYMTCVLIPDASPEDGGNVDCYGDSYYGPDYWGGDAVAVSAGEAHRCVLLSSRNVDCAGDNGNGRTADYTGGDAVAVSAGYQKTCVLLSSGNVDCYGSDNTDYLGEKAIAVSAHMATCVLLDTSHANCDHQHDPSADYDGPPECHEEGATAVCLIFTAPPLLSLGVAPDAGPAHSVAGYVDRYAFTLPNGAVVKVPCVVLEASVVLEAGANACALAGGTFEARLLTLVEQEQKEPAPASIVGVCDAELTVTALGLGIDRFPVVTVC